MRYYNYHLFRKNFFLRTVFLSTKDKVKNRSLVFHEKKVLAKFISKYFQMSIKNYQTKYLLKFLLAHQNILFRKLAKFATHSCTGSSPLNSYQLIATYLILHNFRYIGRYSFMQITYKLALESPI